MKPAGKACERKGMGEERLSLWRCRVNPKNKGPANQDGAKFHEATPSASACIAAESIRVLRENAARLFAPLPY